MNSEKRICQNCKKDFVIEQEDFNFYEKIKVPAPTFCVECKLMRQLMWRNERTLYKRICGLCNKSIIAIYSENFFSPVYCYDCWHGDKWDSADYALEYNFKNLFFEQFNKLLFSVPTLALINIYSVK